MATTPLSSATNGQPTAAVSGSRPDSRVSRTSGNPTRTPRTRTGATWVGLCVAALVLVALIVFMLQNTQLVIVSFLGWQGSVPLALALLIAGIGVGIVALVVGTLRIHQLRRRLARQV
ncbi:MAG: LapA family protein [Cellulosimicrobium funkei]|uniref:DUF1049 domain-containing protein n=1 Tax=Cellulosimicrobium cellulans TaxID=1710 RepID=A0AAV5P842_CELCE|nr:MULTISPECIES: lipopolysaccharide assembly protein LapA domain-containing protein [Cellulosimicrobium]ARK04353.1 hypothetical protein B8281_05940 [Cellulosimicrobium sp. TH-20]QDP73800.1 DUF1049 domain-containing protein [Cellulosimicrobium cellulans]GLY57480.1 hypothetical protein Ccel01_20820 [Cellulosimicrobium cellulans]